MFQMFPTRYFEKQFELAEAVKLPMFLHMRAAAGDFCDILAQNKERLLQLQIDYLKFMAVHGYLCLLDRFVSGVAHSFTGSAEDRDRLLSFENLFIGDYSIYHYNGFEF
ncbi:hypothetical protein BHE74_00022496 [Ensete ventricosum]|nr:hypothetical protein BHE74_00022496 [Ensete ventricosum]